MPNQRRTLAALSGLLLILPNIAGAHVAISDVWTSGRQAYAVPHTDGTLDGAALRGGYAGAPVSSVQHGIAWGGSEGQDRIYGPAAGNVSTQQLIAPNSQIGIVGTTPVISTGALAGEDLVTPVPEPASLLLLGGGLLGLAGASRRKKASSK